MLFQNFLLCSEKQLTDCFKPKPIFQKLQAGNLKNRFSLQIYFVWRGTVFSQHLKIGKIHIKYGLPDYLQMSDTLATVGPASTTGPGQCVPDLHKTMHFSISIIPSQLQCSSSNAKADGNWHYVITFSLLFFL